MELAGALLGAIALALVLVSMDHESGVVTRNWLKLMGHGTITLNVRDGGVRVKLNGAEQAVTRNGQAKVVVVPGAYVIRSMTPGEAIATTYLHEIGRGFQITQEIEDTATDVAIIGPLLTEKLDPKARTELLKKYSQD